MKKKLTLLVILFVCISCAGKQQEKVQEEYVDEIHMQYDEKTFKMPFLDAVLNDSLSVKVFFDTGVPGKYIIIPGRFKNLLSSDTCFVQIGQQKRQMAIDFLDTIQYKSFKVLEQIVDADVVMIGWEFFDEQIIEFSFDNQYIRVYENLPDMSGYSKTNIKVTPTSYLEIPVEIILQGKSIKETAFIDTGNNSYLSLANDLVEKYAIHTTDRKEGKATTNIGPLAGYTIPADTIRVGDLYVADEGMRVAFRPKPPTRPIDGLLGVRFLENFSVILDLKNYDLYLKPLNNQDV